MQIMQMATMMIRVETKLPAEEGAYTTNNNDSAVDEYSGEVAVVAVDDGKVGAEADEDDEKGEEATQGEEEQWNAEFKGAITDAHAFLAVYQRLLIQLSQAKTDLFVRDAEGMDTDT